MQYLKLFVSAVLTVALVIALNSKIGPLPPLGKFMNPFSGFWQNAEGESAYTDLTLPLTGLKEEVQVHFDDRLVPHIFAKNDEDLYYMQGYITARYRLWQMEIQTLNAAGRVSEIAGEKALPSDRLNRRIGMGYGAEKAEEFIRKDEHSTKLIQAYCDGVNAYISSLAPKNYPIEYKLLNYAPEEWKPIKVALLLKNMANMLSVFEYDIENHNFVTQYGMDEFRKLYPDFPEDQDPIIPKGTKWEFGEKVARDKEQGTKETIHANSEKGTTYTAAIEKPDEIEGSNNWAVAGSKTKSGKPILCNDPHLKLSLPSIWYEMHLVSPNMNVYGATLPGSPAVIIGFNDSIAWGVTNGGRDVRDWYQMKFKDATRSEYEYKGEWLKSEQRVEIFKVRGKGEVRDTVIYTKYGPVVFDHTFGEAESNKNLSMSWVAHLPSNEFKTFYQLNSGKNYDDYLNALKTYNCPAQNFVFASRSGDVAIKEQGLFPIRNKTAEQGKYLSDGSTGVDDWTEFIPAEHNPHHKNPERGFVSSANQHPTDETYPYYYPGVGVYETYRNRVINKLLSENNGIDADFMKQMLSNNYNLNAAEALPVLLSLLDQSGINNEEEKILEQLKNWNYYNNAREVAPVYYEIWWNELRKMLWDEMSNPKVPMKQPSFYVTVKFLLRDSTSVFYDNLSTPEKETRTDIVTRSFHRIKDTLAANEFTEVSEPYGVDETFTKDKVNPKDWGTYKDTKIEHLARLDAFSSLHVYNGGNRGIINATNSTHGPSWRMVVDFGDMKQYVVYPGGQSGNPGSRFYNNMVNTWAKGEFYTANYVQRADELGTHKLFTATFKPNTK
ncbi:MAG: penicillin acylase family protein [Chitinophagales bacterium]|nr:penicillin acylase family protein [Chitinophagales bacterium]